MTFTLIIMCCRLASAIPDFYHPHQHQGAQLPRCVSKCHLWPTEDTQHRVCHDAGVSAGWHSFLLEWAVSLVSSEKRGHLLAPVAAPSVSLGTSTLLSLWPLPLPWSFQLLHLIYCRHHFPPDYRRCSSSVLGVAPGVLAKTSWERRKQRAKISSELGEG